MSEGISKADLRYLWRQADAVFQQHRNGCPTCRYNPRSHSLTRLCDVGTKLHNDAERLLDLHEGGLHD